MAFNPRPHEIIAVGQTEYRFALHPASRMKMVYGQEGRKGNVYQLEKLSNLEKYALKIFRPVFRTSNIEVSTSRLKQYSHLPGMEAASRQVISQDLFPDLVKKIPDLSYAVLMPWVADLPWQNVVKGDGLDLTDISIDEWLSLASSAVKVLAQLEAEGLAHSDIAGSNVLVDLEKFEVCLVDLEDIFGVEFELHSAFPMGTTGYQHREAAQSDRGQWCLEGDRFSGAILLAEMIAFHEPRIRDAAYDFSYFSPKEMHDIQSDRYILILEILQNISPPLSYLFQQSWKSGSLKDCPRLAEWQALIGDDLLTTILLALDWAIDNHDSDMLVSLWDKNATLLRTAQVDADYIGSVEQARKRIQALKSFRSAQANSDLQSMWKIYIDNKEELDAYKAFTETDRSTIKELAGPLMQQWGRDLSTAFLTNSDSLIADRYDPLLKDIMALDRNALNRIQLAKSRMNILGKLRDAIDRNNFQEVIEIYDQNNNLILGSTDFTSYERHAVRAAKEKDLLSILEESIANGSPLEIIHAGDNAIRHGCKLAQAHYAALHEAKRFAISLENLRNALNKDDDIAIAIAYKPHYFDHANELSTQDRSRIRQAFATLRV